MLLGRIQVGAHQGAKVVHQAHNLDPHGPELPQQIRRKQIQEQSQISNPTKEKTTRGLGPKLPGFAQ